MMMEDQLRRSQAERKGIKDLKEKVEGILEGLGQAKLAEVDTEVVVEVEVEDMKETWEVLEREFA